MGPYELNWETEQYKCSLSQVIAFVLLANIQGLNLFWLFLILRIAKNYVFNNVKANEMDERSEVEDEEEEEEQQEKGKREGASGDGDGAGAPGPAPSSNTPGGGAGDGEEKGGKNGNATEVSTTSFQREGLQDQRRRLLEGDVPGWIFEKDVSSF